MRSGTLTYRRGEPFRSRLDPPIGIKGPLLTLDRRAGAPSNPRVYALRKVPEVAVAFWITKVLTTGMVCVGYLMASRAGIAYEQA